MSRKRRRLMQIKAGEVEIGDLMLEEHRKREVVEISRPTDPTHRFIDIVFEGGGGRVLEPSHNVEVWR